MPHRRRDRGFSVIELLAIAAVLLVMVAIFIRPANVDQGRRARIGCLNNLKDLGVGARIRSQDENPPNSSATNAVAYFRALSEYFGSPRMLVCPEDKTAAAASSMTNLAASNLSYFASLTALAGPPPPAFVFGDDNLHLGDGKPIAGSLTVRSSTPLAWTQYRHRTSKRALGVVAMNDGSVQQFYDDGLRKALAAQGSFTNILLFR